MHITIVKACSKLTCSGMDPLEKCRRAPSHTPLLRSMTGACEAAARRAVAAGSALGDLSNKRVIVCAFPISV